MSRAVCAEAFALAGIVLLSESGTGKDSERKACKQGRWEAHGTGKIAREMAKQIAKRYGDV